MRLSRLALALTLALGQWLQPMIKPNSGGGGATIAFGAATRVTSFASTNTMSGNSPSVSGTQTLGIASFSADIATAATVTWGGVSMTEVTGAKQLNVNCRSGASQCTMQWFYIVSPAAGVSTVAYSEAGNWGSGAFGCVEYYTGVNATPIDSSSAPAGTGSSSSFSQSYTTSNGNTFIIDNAFQGAGGATLTATAPSTRDTNGSNSNFAWACSHQGVNASAGAYTMAWSSTGTNTWLWNAIAIKQ